MGACLVRGDRFQAWGRHCAWERLKPDGFIGAWRKLVTLGTLSVQYSPFRQNTPNRVIQSDHVSETVELLAIEASSTPQI